MSRKPRARGGQAVTEFALILPVALLLLLAIGDFARFYTDTIAVEAGAREAADYGAFDSSNWTATNTSITVGQMEQRACTAAAALPGYTEPAGTLNHATCTNPVFTCVLGDPASTTDWTPQATADCLSPQDWSPASSTDCSLTLTSPPCNVHVTLTYEFNTFIGGLCLQGTPLCLPSSLTIQRDSRYAISGFPSS